MAGRQGDRVAGRHSLAFRSNLVDRIQKLFKCGKA